MIPLFMTEKYRAPSGDWMQHLSIAIYVTQVWGSCMLKRSCSTYTDIVYWCAHKLICICGILKGIFKNN